MANFWKNLFSAPKEEENKVPSEEDFKANDEPTLKETSNFNIKWIHEYFRKKSIDFKHQGERDASNTAGYADNKERSIESIYSNSILIFYKSEQYYTEKIEHLTVRINKLESNGLEHQAKGYNRTLENIKKNLEKVSALKEEFKGRKGDFYNLIINNYTEGFDNYTSNHRTLTEFDLS